MSTSPLSPDEIERYARHIVLPEVGGVGQQKLKAARVLVIGAGGLGAPVLLYLAAAGVGTIAIVDNDEVSLSNLQRQIIHGTPDISKPKVESAEDAMTRINPHVAVVTHAERLDASNAERIFSGYDIVVDGSDNFETRYLVADVAERMEISLVTGAVGRFDGSLTVLRPWVQGPDGRLNPRYRDLFPEPPAPGVVPSCAEAGIVGALTGVIGTLQAMEVIKLITEAGAPLIGRLLLYDAVAARFETIRYRRRAPHEVE
ncbi:molybdopterin/thiamine biosynthesis adenylyltransferase [Pararhizobium capsulatum DSM 1112]|uniref:Molybdopterin/thiamine biosynthesis adenylyltransferase n=1 Tax=Pararhizobium capsulatum DSM 1112 TaxID=1121113 RepID=A0ABU0BJB5_9HYPH|nr:molybdopterin-synthase adenylyltransferase MoeB [Pararhizobium capsulatum]MDQ0318343.1 molybdopterin/thiamine biosynthesis adenylyltransferase [Pararhizobium capsulatum DSM 1112]